MIVASLYLPNGNPWPGPKFDYKMAWFERLLVHARSLQRSGRPVVLAGDYNVVPTDVDNYWPTSWLDNALLQPKPRAVFTKLRQQGWVDAVRTVHPLAPAYTFWDHQRNRWPRDAGLRIDHLLVSKSQKAAIVDAGVDRADRGLENASDHAPAWVELSGRGYGNGAH